MRTGIAIVAAAGLLLVQSLAAQAAAPGPDVVNPANRARYEACLALTRTAPQKAFETALAWHDQGGDLAADHCAAVALVALGHYDEAAARLERLAHNLDRIGSALTPAVLDQAANSWLLANQPAAAVEDTTAALKLDPKSADYRIDRARAYAASGRYGDAARDLDAVIRLAPGRADAYAYRAAARRRLGDRKGALADADAALARDPNSTGALLERGLLRRDAGDKKGARQDWLRILQLAPGTAVGRAAQSDLQAMDLAPH